MTNRMLDAALSYAGRGWPVLPIVPGGKKPLGELVPNGFHDATTEVELVRAWWTAYPTANVGVATGHPAFDVLDVDVKAAGTGWPAFNRCKAAGILPVPFMVVTTPSGGMHAYYVGTGQSCGSLPKSFIDFKAAGGYVVVPPSTVDGRPYQLISERPTERHQLNWSAVKDFLNPPRPITTAPRRPTAGTGIPGLAAWLADKTKPGRNAALFWASCRAVENGATEAELHELYRGMQFGDGFDERQAARTVADAYRTIRRSA
ncbi:bifunctional DNA primase/polymerase [Streptosporangium pseudovulgare]|uniref:Prophage P3 protein 7, DNA replication n=1 Tax=Streptosporangium pseudovulgare TaxID=35765 RepID=A0ABQ2RBE3_9ACTN|nr:bifunctional DNA primase/polymerase [Streptosporangium pseudovulgare]GGQ20728.1 prophage P3 protein 7, DNA replication [Streptosporangium pseudovulgare]